MTTERNILISITANDGMYWTKVLRLQPEEWNVIGVGVLSQALHGRRPPLVMMTPGAAHHLFEERRDWQETLAVLRERCPSILALKEV